MSLHSFKSRGLKIWNSRFSQYFRWTSSSSSKQVEEWLGQFDRPGVSLIDNLCWNHGNTPCLKVFADTSEFSFQEMGERSEVLAGLLHNIGVSKGDRICGMLPKSKELLTTVLAAAHLGAVYVPLFTAFGPKAAAYRIEDCNASVVVATTDQREKLNEVAGDRLMVTVNPTTAQLQAGDISYDQTTTFIPEATTMNGDDLMSMVYTSGTTGHPKGVEIPVRALPSFLAYLKYGLGVEPGDNYWNAADPGWAYGLYFNVYATLAAGHCSIYAGPRFDAKENAALLSHYQVTHLATAPTWYRAMRTSGELEPVADQIPLRCASSAGEPLTPATNDWFQELFDTRILDHYGQSENGMMVVNAHHPEERQQKVADFSMGTSHVGFHACIVDAEGKDAESGTLAINVPKSPLFWFRGYWGDEKRSKERFIGDTFLTGDNVYKQGGQFFFKSREDDIITSSGYRIGPFEVEAGLSHHPSVAECAVVGVSDPQKTEVIKAFVVPRPEFPATDELGIELRQFVKKTLSAHLQPHIIEFVTELPKTPSQKVQRFLLRK